MSAQGPGITPLCWASLSILFSHLYTTLLIVNKMFTFYIYLETYNLYFSFSYSLPWVFLCWRPSGLLARCQCSTHTFSLFQRREQTIFTWYQQISLSPKILSNGSIFFLTLFNHSIWADTTSVGFHFQKITYSSKIKILLLYCLSRCILHLLLELRTIHLLLWWSVWQ